MCLQPRPAHLPAGLQLELLLRPPSRACRATLCCQVMQSFLLLFLGTHCHSQSAHFVPPSISYSSISSRFHAPVSHGVAPDLRVHPRQEAAASMTPLRHRRHRLQVLHADDVYTRHTETMSLYLPDAVVWHLEARNLIMDALDHRPYDYTHDHRLLAARWPAWHTMDLSQSL